MVAFDGWRVQVGPFDDADNHFGGGPVHAVAVSRDSCSNSAQATARDPFARRGFRLFEKRRKLGNRQRICGTRPVRRNGRMTFKPVKINANLRKPRVEFQEEYLKVGISEESYGADFFEKVNDPLKDSEF